MLNTINITYSTTRASSLIYLGWKFRKARSSDLFGTFITFPCLTLDGRAVLSRVNAECIRKVVMIFCPE